MTLRPPATGQQGPLPQVLIDDLLDASEIMLWFAHVIDSGPPLPLGRALGDLHALYERAVDLDAHLHGDLGQVVAQEHRCVWSRSLDGQDHAGEWLPGLKRRVQNVAHLCPVDVRLVEESCPRARRV